MRIAIVHPYDRDTFPEEEIQRRETRVAGLVHPETDLEHFYLLGASIMTRTFGDAEHVQSTLVVMHERIMEAAATRPDAISIHGGVEPGVAAAREAVPDIPIIGTGEATYSIARQLGARLGLLVFEPALIEPITAIAKQHGMGKMVVNCRDIGTTLPELYPNRPQVRERVVEQSRRLVEKDGATAIFAQGLSMVPCSISAAELSERIGVTVLDGEMCTLRTAELCGALASPKATEQA